MTQTPEAIGGSGGGVAVMDPNNSTNAIPNTLVVNADGSINVVSSASGTFEASAIANAAAPTYVEATVNPLSQDLNGNLRTSATPVKSTTFTPTQVTVPATANGILIIAANTARLGASITNPGPADVYVQQGATGVTTSNGWAIPAGTAFNIDSPLYTGALYGIVASGTQVVTVGELT